MEIFNEDAKNAISQAYDNLKRDEFLNRIFSFIDEESVTRQIFDGIKTKPGPRAKTELTA